MFRRNYHSVIIAVRITASLLPYVYITVRMSVSIAVRMSVSIAVRMSVSIAVRICITLAVPISPYVSQYKYRLRDHSAT